MPTMRKPSQDSLHSCSATLYITVLPPQPVCTFDSWMTASGGIKTGCSWRREYKEYAFKDPFKAEYPPKPSRSGMYRRQIKLLQEFYQKFSNCYKSTAQPRYQFSLSNKLLWVSSDSVVPKRCSRTSMRGGSAADHKGTSRSHRAAYL
jgi:hypothetical protein